MAYLAPAEHTAVLTAIREAQADVEILRKRNTPKVGYHGFNLVGKALADCHGALAGERDHARVVAILKSAVQHLALVGGGDVGPAVARTNKTLRGLLETLEP
jgi:hypothetical protein